MEMVGVWASLGLRVSWDIHACTQGEKGWKVERRGTSLWLPKGFARVILLLWKG